MQTQAGLYEILDADECIRIVVGKVINQTLKSNIANGAVLVIIANHYVVNSTETSLFDPLHPSANQIFMWQYMVSDSHKLMAFAVALFAFLTFKNWSLPQSRFINSVASTTFGVLLIHAASDGMRKWLWQDFVNVPSAYAMPFVSLIGYSFIVMLGVFVVCFVLDYLRIRFIERPIFKLFK